MPNEVVKERLIAAATSLLSLTEDPASITVRQIANKAQANQAMINYYYGSKNDLIQQAIHRLLQDTMQSWQNMTDLSLPPRQKLEQMLLTLSDLMVQYGSFAKASIRHELTKGEIVTPVYILPVLKEIFADSKAEKELKIMAYQIISFMQLIFLRAEGFLKYTGADIADRAVRHEMIQMQLEWFLGGGGNEHKL